VKAKKAITLAIDAMQRRQKALVVQHHAYIGGVVVGRLRNRMCEIHHQKYMDLEEAIELFEEWKDEL
jgi:hypothetical protein